MNQNSKLCVFISEHPNNWGKLLSEKRIRSRIKGNLCIFNYLAGADFFDEIVREARGIIIDLDSLEVVCWPFTKFGNWNDPYVDKIDWASAKVQEKIDGSIVKCYFYGGEWHWASNAHIDAADAQIDGLTNHSFQDLIEWAVNYPEVQKVLSNTEDTYIFELTSPWNRVVIPQTKTLLTLTGIRNNKTGEEYTYNGTFNKPDEYPLTSFEDCVKMLATFNKGTDIKHEGFVVVDKDFHRIKIKTAEYFECHHVWNNGLGISKKRVVKMLMEEDADMIERVSKVYPHAHPVIEHYKSSIVGLTEKIQALMNEARALYTGDNRRELVEKYKGNSFTEFIFLALDHPEETASDFLSKLTIGKLCDLIPDYETGGADNA